jgi:hypothetical protein
MKQSVGLIIGALTTSAEFYSKVSAAPTVYEISRLADRWLDRNLSSHTQTIKASCQKLIEESEHLKAEIDNALSNTSSIVVSVIKAQYNCIKMSQSALKAHYGNWLSFWDWFEKLSNQQVAPSKEQCNLASLNKELIKMPG